MDTIDILKQELDKENLGKYEILEVTPEQSGHQCSGFILTKGNKIFSFWLWVDSKKHKYIIDHGTFAVEGKEVSYWREIDSADLEKYPSWQERLDVARKKLGIK